MEKDQFGEMIRRLDRMERVQALQLVGEKKGKDAIASLSLAGFQPKEIADLLGTTSNTVSVTLNALKNEKRKNEKNA